MSEFYLRVQLDAVNHVEPSKTTYDALHTRMATLGGYRTIEGSSGKRYRLPHAQYYFPEWAGTATDLVDEVYAIAKSLWSKPEVLAIKGDHAAFNGLPEVR